MSTPTAVQPAGFVIDRVSRGDYESLLDWIGDRPIRVNYDRGALELMSPSTEHEFAKDGLITLLKLLALGLDQAIRGGGSPTLRSPMADRGLEPGACFWISHEPAMRQKLTWDAAIDPPPDLVIEVERSRTVLDRLEILAALGIPEVWRFDGQTLRILTLQPDGTYAESCESPSFPGVPIGRVTDFVGKVADQGETAVMRDFLAWIQAGFPAP
ncbi:MAG: Uma2 family endonuclease [Isosphaeraceae bacterium]